MVKMSPRFSLNRLEEYKVETVPDADIVVNANETNWPLAKSLVAKVKNQIDNFAFNRYPPMHAIPVIIPALAIPCGTVLPEKAYR